MRVGGSGFTAASLAGLGVLGLLGSGCAEPPVAAGPSPSLALTSIWLSSDADHLVEIVRFADVWYATNSNDQFSAVRLLADGGLEPVFAKLDLGFRCATADVHPASATLLCSNEYDGRVYALSLADPSAPVVVGEVELSLPVAAGEPDPVPVSDVHVWGDEVWLAGYMTGIWRAPIAADGTLATFEQVADPGNVRKLEHAGDELLALVGERGLVVLTRDADGGWTERGAVALDGPLIDLAAEPGRAAVALGSAGAVVVDVATLTVVDEATVHPASVATSVALRGDRLAVGSLAGLFVYALGDPEPALIGFARAGDPYHPQPGTMLDVAFEGGDELLVTDWYRLHRVTVDEAGAIVDLDHATGLYRRPGDPITIALRNYGPVERDVEAVMFGVELGRARIPAGGEAALSVDVDAELLAELFPPDSTRRIELRARQPDGASLGVQATLVATTAVDHDPAVDGKPAPGMRFPSVQLARWEGEPLSLPLAAEAALVVFFTEDCQAMWPQVLDAAWLWRRGQLDGGATLVFATNGPLDAGSPPTQFAARMDVGDVPAGYFENVNAAIEAVNGPLMPLYERGFALDRLESAAVHPTDYLVDADGRVLAVEREYRGAFPLRGAP